MGTAERENLLRGERMTRRARHLGSVETSILSKGATGVISSLGFAFPGFGALIGFALSKLGVFSDRPSAATVDLYARLAAIGNAVKARDYAGAASAFDWPLFETATQFNGPGFIEPMFFVAIMGDAVENGNRARALQFARDIDNAQAKWDAWKARNLAEIAAARDVALDVATGADDAQRDSVVMEYDFDRGHYVSYIVNDDGTRDLVRQHGDG